MKARLLLPIIITLFLTGCMTTGLFAGGAVGASLANDKRDTKTIVDDNTVNHNIGVALNQNNDVTNQANISTACYHQIVLMVGQAPTQDIKNAAYKIALNNPKVRRVYNEITIAAPTSALTRASDAWITTKTKTELLAQSDLKSSRIKAVTEDGVVYLMGQTTSKQAQKAAEVVSNISGVQKVVKLFEYIA